VAAVAGSDENLLSRLFYKQDDPVAIALEDAFEGWLGLKVRTEFPSVTTRTRLSAAAFDAEYKQTRTPVILQHALSEWPALQRWSFEDLAQRCADVVVTANSYSICDDRQVRFADLVAQIRNGPRSGESAPYLQEWQFQKDCPFLLDDVGELAYIADDAQKKLLGFHNAVLWIGARGARTRLHRDFAWMSTFHAQIRGRKQWILLHPDAVLRHRADGEPDFAGLVAGGRAKVFHCVLEPGELLYVPYHWWHRVRTLEDGISLSFHAVEEECARDHFRAVLGALIELALNGDAMRVADPARHEIATRRFREYAKLLG